jgi:glycosyltransferase involved in cell wall biosynthesis
MMMKVLIVCSGNWAYIKPFISEQVDALIAAGIECDYFLITGKGTFGYLKNLSRLKKTIRKKKYDLIHAHYGLSGLLAVMQRKLPVIVTFHGVDLIDKDNDFCKSKHINKFHVSLSRIAARHSAFNIFVNKKIILFPTKPHTVISCGVDPSIFYPIDKQTSKEKLSFGERKIHILFASSFDYGVRKNFLLAKETVSLIEGAELIELKNYSRERVCNLMNACDLLLVTSFFETGPQVVKEAMACNCPIVSTDIGDVREVIGNTEGCYICSYDPTDMAEKIKLALAFGRRTNGREKILKYDNNLIAEKVIDVYKKVLKDKL